MCQTSETGGTSNRQIIHVLCGTNINDTIYIYALESVAADKGKKQT